MLSIRCSSLDRVAACPPAATPPAVRIDTPTDAGALGTAVHDHNEFLIRGDAVDVDELAVRHNCDRDQLAKLCGLSRGAWKTLKDFFPHPQTEVEMSWVDSEFGITLTGHADVMSVDDNVLSILDWKSGWGDVDHSNQVRGYAWLAIQDRPEIDRVRTYVVRLRGGELDTQEYSRGELEQWWRGLAAALTTLRDSYHPSAEACGYCPRRHECPAYTAMVRQAAMVVQAASYEEAPASLTPENLGGILEFAKMAEAYCKQARQLVRTQVIAAGGVIPLGDGTELAIEHGEKREINFAAAEGVLAAHIGERWREVVKIGNGDIETIVGELAPPRGKGKAIKALWSELAAADAFTFVPTETLKLRKATTNKLIPQTREV